MPREITVPTDDGRLDKLMCWPMLEAADVLGLHYDTLRARVRTGQYPHIRVGQLVYFTEDQLHRIAASYVHVHEYPAHT